MKKFKFLTSTLLFALILTAGFNTVNAQCSSKSTTWSSWDSKSNLVELVAGSEDLSTLVAAVKAADLVEVLGSEGPFTVFAPTNDAFAALPEGTVENLLKPENKDDLIKVLTYHVIPGRFEASDFSSDRSIETVEGTEVKVTSGSDIVRVNNAVVVKADKRASNGVVHKIDRVIIPGEI